MRCPPSQFRFGFGFRVGFVFTVAWYDFLGVGLDLYKPDINTPPSTKGGHGALPPLDAYVSKNPKSQNLR
jgi:hypothetical protein